MARSAASVLVGALVFSAQVAAQAAAAGKAHDDREVMGRTVEVAKALVQAVPGPRQCDSKADGFKKDPIKGHLAELRLIERTLRSASRRGGPDEIRRLRAAVAGKTAVLTKAVTAYGASAVSYASLGKQIKVHQKTKPKC